ncbi:MAG: O-antigen ligase family protein [Ignavibacteriales bacterium]|nr:O-antigen ligase family protein [Ignavibacteriales bacterium]
MSYDLHTYFTIGILAIAGIGLIYIWFKYFETAVFFFALTPLISTIFFDNLPEETLVATEATIGIGGTLRAIFLGILGAVGLIKFLLSIPRHKLKIPVHIVLLGIFILISLLSTFYSLDQKFTLIRSGLFTAVLGFLLGLYSWLKEDDANLEKTLNSLFVLVLIITFTTLAGLVLMPSRIWWWKLPRLVGLWEHPNTFGSFSMLAYPIILWKFYNSESSKRYLIVFPLIITIIFHILTGSRTTLLASGIGVIVWLLLERDWIKLVVASVVIGTSVILLLNFSPKSFQRLESSDITDLSSREDIWNSALIFIKEKPIQGYGFGVEGAIFQDELKVDLEGSFIERTVRQSLHNGYLSILVGGGFFGLILWIIILLLPLIFSFSTNFSPIKAYAVFTLLTVILTNFVESALTGYSKPTDIFFWLAWIILGIVWQSDNKVNLKHTPESIS